MQSRDSSLSQAKRVFASRRTHVRYPLRVSVDYRWKDNAGIDRGGKGWTRNISEDGAFIQTGDCPAEHVSVDLLFRIPRMRTASPSTRMTMEAKVVRVERSVEEGYELGFAVQKRAVAADGDEGTSNLAGARAYALGSRVN
jgi:PilZ domain